MKLFPNSNMEAKIMLSKQFQQNIKLEYQIYDSLKDSISCSFKDWCIKQNVLGQGYSEEDYKEAMDLISKYF